MKRSLDRLFRVLTPCPLAAGFREPVSRCKVCGRDVLDLSQFTREEAAQLLSTNEPPCVRFVMRGGRPLFRTAVVTATLAGAALSFARAAVERPPIVQILDAPVRTGGVVAGGHQWR